MGKETETSACVSTPDSITAARTFALSDLYALLAATMRLPDECLVEGLLDNSFAFDLHDILVELGANPDRCVQALEGAVAAQSQSGGFLDKLRCEYTHLFTHPTSPVIRPYETAYVNGLKSAAGREVNQSLFVSAASHDASLRYREAGLELDRSLSNEPADHIFFELEFLSAMYLRLGAAIEAGDTDGANQARHAIEDFERVHVAAWFDGFFSTVAAQADEAPVYAAIAGIWEASGSSQN